MAEAAATSTDSSPSVPPRQFIALLVLAAIVGLVVSLASWCFLEGVHWTQVRVFDDLPDAVGYDDGAPVWWPLGVVVAYLTARVLSGLESSRTAAESGAGAG